MSYMKSKIISAFVLLFFAFGCMTHPDEKKYVDKIKEKYPDAKMFDFEIKNNFVEVEFVYDNKLYDAGMTTKPELLYAEYETELSNNIKEIIDQKIKSGYDDWLVDEYAFVEMPNDSFYKVELINDGLEENLYFTLQGKYVKTNSLKTDKSWTSRDISEKKKKKHITYDFLHPKETIELPDILHEISGIVWLSPTELYCIQDEKGIIFKYNLQQKKITNRFEFEKTGDFEDIAINNDLVYVLQSDGKIYWVNLQSKKQKVHDKHIDVKSDNIEGLFFSSKAQKLYMACKAPTNNQKKDEREIVAVAPDKMGDPEVQLTIQTEEIVQFIQQHYPSFKHTQIRFNPSAMAFHPLTDDEYILSAKDRILAIYANNKLKAAYPLPEEIYYQPEGMTFDPEGNLYLSSEGNKKGNTPGKIFFIPTLN